MHPLRITAFAATAVEISALTQAVRLRNSAECAAHPATPEADYARHKQNRLPAQTEPNIHASRLCGKFDRSHRPAADESATLTPSSVIKERQTDYQRQRDGKSLARWYNAPKRRVIADITQRACAIAFGNVNGNYGRRIRHARAGRRRSCDITIMNIGFTTPSRWVSRAGNTAQTFRSSDTRYTLCMTRSTPAFPVR